jgi:Na+/melibiose symporter-like transporter
MNRNKKKNSKTEEEKFAYSSGVHWSYGIGGFLTNFTTTALGVRLTYFYINEIGLAVILYGIANILLGFWNMINDPLMGYLSDGKYNFQKKWGRRFPWFVPTAIGCGVFYMLIFLVPFNAMIGMFIWLIIMSFSYELTYTTWNANYIALYPEKFRSEKERTKVAGINTATGQLGVAFGILLPPLLITEGQLDSYIITAVIIMLINIVFAILMIPGMREGKELRSKKIELQETEHNIKNFFESLKYVAKQKNLGIYLFAYLAHQVLTFLMLAMLPFWTNYLVDSIDASTAELILAAAFLLGGLISVPFWMKIGRKYGNRKGLFYGMFATSLFFIPMMFISNLIVTAITILILGFGIGAMWTLMYPGFSDVLDENVLITEQRREGTYNGVRMFIGRFGSVLQGMAITLVFTFTGFVEGSPTQTPLAIFGIRILMALIPMLFYFVASIMIWKFSDLSKEKVSKIKEELNIKGF